MAKNAQERQMNTALFAAVASNVIFGFSFMATRIALGYTTPAVLLSIRFTASFLIMFGMFLIGIGKVRLKGKPIGKFLLMALCEPVIYFFAETNGIKYTSSSFSGLMISAIPVATALLSVVILHEKLSLCRLCWILCSVAGVTLISATQTNEGIITLRGVIYLFIAMITAAFYSILTRSIAQEFSAFERTFVMMMMGWIVFTGSAIMEQGAGFVPAFAAAVQNKHVMLPVLFLSIASSVISYFCLNYAVTFLEVNRIAVFANIIPVVSVLAGVLILGEPFSAICVAGIVLILLGVYKVNSVD